MSKLAHIPLIEGEVGEMPFDYNLIVTCYPCSKLESKDPQRTTLDEILSHAGHETMLTMREQYVALPVTEMVDTINHRRKYQDKGLGGRWFERGIILKPHEMLMHFGLNSAQEKITLSRNLAKLYLISKRVIGTYSKENKTLKTSIPVRLNGVGFVIDKYWLSHYLLGLTENYLEGNFFEGFSNNGFFF